MTLTSDPSIRTDLRNTGAKVDDEVVADLGSSFPTALMIFQTSAQSSSKSSPQSGATAK